MRVCMLTLGTLGDVAPFVALGKALQSAGHSVSVCASEQFESFITGHGLEYAYMNDQGDKLLRSELRRSRFDCESRFHKQMLTAFQVLKQARPLLSAMVKESWDAVQAAKPDLILYHPMAFFGAHFAEALGIRSMLAAVWPQWVATGDFPTTCFPSLGRWGNRNTYRIVLKLAQLGMNRYIQEWQCNNGLPRSPRRIDLLYGVDGNPLPILHCFSSHVVPRPRDWPDAAQVTGYWFLNEQDDWQPPRELAEFLSAGDPPVYVGFGSMGRSRPQALTRIVVEALQQACVRGIISSGWDGLETGDLPETIFGVDNVPHDWLFPRVAAVVHHGGAGTTAAGLRAGRPTVICPFFGDQPFWGKRVYQLGVGCRPIRQKNLTVENLSRSIREVTGSESILRKAAVLGGKICAENGVANAVAIIEGIVSDRGS